MMSVLTDNELKKRERQKKIATLKATNELLEESKKKVLENKKLSDEERTARLKDIEEAQTNNIRTAEISYSASVDEINNAEYSEVSEHYVELYNERLKQRGQTDEELHRKEQTIVTGSVETENTGRKRRHTSRKSKQTDVEVKNEEPTISLTVEKDVMNATRMSDDVDIDDFINKKEREIKSNSAKGENTIDAIVTNSLESKKVTVTPIEERPVEVKKKSKKKNDENSSYEFDFSTIPSNVQFDMIPLPSKGECYAHKHSRIPVAYLTAADESLISSPNMYRDGRIMDVILKRKILDKSIKVEELVKGDRDAIILWLRATGYGLDFPVVVTHPRTKKKYDINVKLDSFKYYDFDLVGDENGYFEYITDGGDVLKFKLYTDADQEELKKLSRQETINVNVFQTLKSVNAIEECIDDMINVSDEIKEDLRGCVTDIREIVKEIQGEEDIDEEGLFADLMIKQLQLQTMSVNGNTDREYINSYVNNMRAGETRKYRVYLAEHTPGVDFSVHVDIPQNEGGSFDTFLRFDDTVFLNV